MYGDMPPLVDQPSFMSPPMGASNGGKPGDGGFLAAFPGAARSAGSTSPYWPAQGTPFPSSAAGPAGWPITPTTPHTYNAAFPTSATSWTHGGAQPAPPTRGGYVPWVGGQAASGSSPGGSWGPRTPGEGVASGWGAYSPWSAPAASGGGAGWGTSAGGGGGAGWGTPGGGSGGWGTPAGGSAGWGTPSSAGGGWGPTLPGTATYESASGQPITAGYFGGADVDAHGFPVRLGRSHSKKERRKSQSRHLRNSSSHGHARFDLAFGGDDSDSDWTHVHHHDSAFSQALRRSNSHSAAAAKHRPPRVSPHHTPEHVHRSLSWGNEPTRDPFFSPPAHASGTAWDPYTISAYQLAGAQANLPAYLKGDVYDENNLAKRPRDWRADYVPRQSLGSGLATLVLGKGRSDVRDFSDPVKRRLSSHLLYEPNQPPFYWDMTIAPFEASPIHFNNFNRPPNSLDMAQMASQPPTSSMRLFHPKLPWYIDIVARHTNGITVVDLFEQMHRQLHTPILGRHFWNDELGQEERGEITRAFVRRCRGEVEKVRKGVVQLDFLGRKVVFEGLVRGPKGMWEMKMGRPNEPGA